MNKIFVGGISQETSEEDLLQYFSNYGKISSARIVYDSKTGSLGLPQGLPKDSASSKPPAETPSTVS